MIVGWLIPVATCWSASVMVGNGRGPASGVPGGASGFGGPSGVPGPASGPGGASTTALGLDEQALIRATTSARRMPAILADSASGSGHAVDLVALVEDH